MLLHSTDLPAGIYAAIMINFDNSPEFFFGSLIIIINLRTHDEKTNLCLIIGHATWHRQ